MKDLFQRIFLSSDPENDAIKELVYDCLYLPWLKGDFMPEFAPEWAGSYLIPLQKATYTNFKQLSLSKDGDSHCLYFLNAVYPDPAFTSAEDEGRSLVIMTVALKLMKNSKQPCMS